MKAKKYFLIWLLGILILTALIFAPSITFDFVNWDDQVYVTDNLQIRELSWPSIIKMFFSNVMGNYQPLVVLSLAFDFKHFGLNPAGYHFTNILFHILNVILVFSFLRLIRQNLKLNLLVTFLFALHPLRVESVAWVTERKDVLHLCMYLLSLNFYLFSKRFSGRVNIYYFTSLIFYIFALLSKPAAVTLPFILLLLDWYENNRITPKEVKNKIPWFILSLLLGVVTIYGYNQPVNFDYQKVYFFSSFNHFFMGFYSFLLYIAKLLWPVQLVCFYPYPQVTQGMLPWPYYVSPLAVVFVGWITYKIIQNKKVFYFGSLFFLMSIMTNLAFINFGNVLIADRYTYLPSVGFFLVFAQIYFEQIQAWNKKVLLRLSAVSLLFFLLLIMCVQTFCQMSIWKNSLTLWSQVIRYYPETTEAWFNRGTYYSLHGEYQKALEDFNVLLNKDPQNYSAFNNRGNLHFALLDDQKALEDYNQAIALCPGCINSRINRAVYFQNKQRYSEALKDIEFALSKDPDDIFAINIKNNIIEKMKPSS